MEFPGWVNRSAGGGRARRETVASNRLRYLIKRIAIEHNDKGSVEQIARLLGMHHSTFSIYIRRGHFSEAAALKLERTFGRDIVRAEWLRDPLNAQPLK